MFPYVTVVECPQNQMIERIGQTWSAQHHEDKAGNASFIDATNIDRLNMAPSSINLTGLQRHEGNIVDFLFRARVPDPGGTIEVKLSASEVLQRVQELQGLRFMGAEQKRRAIIGSLASALNPQISRHLFWSRCLGRGVMFDVPLSSTQCHLTQISCYF